MQKILMGMTVLNRLELTRQTIESLFETTDLSLIDLHVVNNGSVENGVAEYLDSLDGVTVHHLSENVGTALALNMVIERHRLPGQHFIKIDNDVRIGAAYWLDVWRKLWESDPGIALIGPYIPGSFEKRFQAWRISAGGVKYAACFPILGALTFHSGPFMDRVGYFDKLAPQHVYGFDDLVMSEKARALGLKTAISTEFEIEHTQRSSRYTSYAGQDKPDHVAEIRPFFEERCAEIQRGQRIYTGPDGLPSGV